MHDLVILAAELVDQETGIPAWMWLTVALATVFSGTLGVVLTYLVQRPVKRQLRNIAQDARETREQTANQHDDAPHPNLRDDLDAKFAGMLSEMRVIGGQVRVVVLDIGGMREDLRLERRDRAEGDAALARRAEEFGDTLSKHLRDK